MDYEHQLKKQEEEAARRANLIDPDPAGLTINPSGQDVVMNEMLGIGLTKDGKPKVLSNDDFKDAVAAVSKNGAYKGQKLNFSKTSENAPGLGVIAPGKYQKINEEYQKKNKTGKYRMSNPNASGKSFWQRLFSPESLMDDDSVDKNTRDEYIKSRSIGDVTLYNKSGTLKSKKAFMDQSADPYTRQVLAKYYDDAIVNINNMRKDRDIKTNGKLGETVYPFAKTLAHEVNSITPYAKKSMVADVNRIEAMPEKNKEDLIKRMIEANDAVFVDSYRRKTDDAGDFEIKGRKVSGDKVQEFFPKKKDGSYDYSKMSFFASTKGGNVGFIIRNLETGKDMFVKSDKIGGNVASIFRLNSSVPQFAHQVNSDIKKVKDNLGYNTDQAIDYLRRYDPNYSGFSHQDLYDLDEQIQENWTLLYSQLTATTSPDASNATNIIAQPSRKNFLDE
jgi:hypothetical protein